MHLCHDITGIVQALALRLDDLGRRISCFLEKSCRAFPGTLSADDYKPLEKIIEKIGTSMQRYRQLKTRLDKAVVD